MVRGRVHSHLELRYCHVCYRNVGYRYTATPDNIDDIDIGKIFTNNDFVINETLDIGTFSNIGLVINDNLDIGNFFQYRVRWGLLVRLG